MADRYYIGARYVPAVYEGPDGSNTWLPGVAYDGLVIVTYGNYSYMSKKPVPAGMDPPDVNTSYWIKAAVYNADVNNVVEQLDNVVEQLDNVVEQLDQKADKDGVYPDLFAGNLISDTMLTDNAPYLERETGGGLSNISGICYPVLVGASVVENQLCNGESVTVPNGRKYYLKKSGVESLGASAGSAITGLTSGSDMVIDLTQMLGSSIADYAYTLEQATAGSGIAWLRSYGFLTDDYVPYNTGTIESVEATAKVVRDENNENAVTYPLGSDVLRGIFKLDANNNLYADGDRKEADGTITRKYKKIVIDENVDILTGASGMPFRFRITDKKQTTSTSDLPNAIADKLKAVTQASTWGIPFTFSFILNQESMFFKLSDSITTIEDAKTCLASNPITLVYELATPTTETSTPFTSPQVCYPDGTEEYVTENNVPVGHETGYPYDLKGILEKLAEVPAANGTYTLKATRSGADITYTWDQEV